MSGVFRVGAALALAMLASALLYLFLLGACWLPATRTLEVAIQGPGSGVLKVMPDVGRGFYDADAVYLALLPSMRVAVIEVPVRTRRMTVELTSGEPGTSVASVSAVTRTGRTVLIPERTFPPEFNLAPVKDRIPLGGHLLSVILAVSVVFGPLSSARARTRLRDWASCVARPRWFCSVAGASAVWALFLGVVLIIGKAGAVYHLLVRAIDVPRYWPISIFDPVWPTASATVAAAGLFVLAGVAQRANVVRCLAIGLVFLCATNLFHGWFAGYVRPSSGEQSYLYEARSIASGLDFLRAFTQIQSGLSTHSRTHPPGAVLVYHALLQLTSDPGVVSLLLGALSFTTTALFVFAIVRSRVGNRAAARTLMLFVFVPAVQIYFLSCLDGLICACFAGTIYFFLHERQRVRHVGTAIFLVLSMSLSFAASFLWLLLALYDVRLRRSVRSFAVSAGTSVLVYVLVDLALGFSWMKSFLIASSLENRHGFALFENPGTYLFTRLEGVAEILLFAGPLLILAWWRGVASSRPDLRELRWLSIAGVGSLALVLASGAFKTGETARACLFIYPLIVAPLAGITGGAGAWRSGEQRALLSALTSQTLLMQLFGDYYW